MELQVALCRFRYRLRLSVCRKKYRAHQSLRVVFLLSDLCKWKLQSLYDELERSEWAVPLIAISARGDWWLHPEYEPLQREMIEYFGKRGMRYEVVASFQSKHHVPLRSLEPDIVFYSQPYDWPAEYLPVTVSRYSLTCYVPYFVPSHEEIPLHYALPVHRMVYRFFHQNAQWESLLRGLTRPGFYAGKVVGLGHPFLDFYHWHGAHSDPHGYTIYAPHWSFDHPNNQNTQNISTFLEMGDAVLAFAKNHPDLKWVFKPHPDLYWSLIQSGAWDKPRVDAYYAGWRSIATTCESCDYMELFVASRALITDCASFIVEYPPCGGAMIHLLNPTQKIALHPLNMEMYDAFYKVHDQKELAEVLDLVLVRGLDPKREERMAAVCKLAFGDNYAAGNICNYLAELLRTK